MWGKSQYPGRYAAPETWCPTGHCTFAFELHHVRGPVQLRLKHVPCGAGTQQPTTRKARCPTAPLPVQRITCTALLSPLQQPHRQNPDNTISGAMPSHQQSSSLSQSAQSVHPQAQQAVQHLHAQ